MGTSKKYGLILSDDLVKIVEVTVSTGMFDSFCLVPLRDELDDKLIEFLQKNNIKPLLIIPDTALSSGNEEEFIYRDANNFEKEELFLVYKEDFLPYVEDGTPNIHCHEKVGFWWY